MDFRALVTFILSTCPLQKGGSVSASGSVWLDSYFILLYVPWNVGLLGFFGVGVFGIFCTVGFVIIFSF